MPLKDRKDFHTDVMGVSMAVRQSAGLVGVT